MGVPDLRLVGVEDRGVVAEVVVRLLPLGIAPANDCALMKAFESTLDNGRSRPWILPLWEALNWISNGGREAGADRRFSADPLRSAVSR
jgi:hypothetical protein